MHAMQRYTPRLKRYLDAIHDGESREVLQKLRTELRIDHILGDLQPLLDVRWKARSARAILWMA